MGLDSFWVHPNDTDEHKETHPEFTPELRLCGGMFSEFGSGSFRGKEYSAFIEDWTDFHLYHELMDNETVAEIGLHLQRYADNMVSHDLTLHTNYDISEDEVRDLARMFVAYGAAGFELVGWW